MKVLNQNKNINFTSIPVNEVKVLSSKGAYILSPQCAIVSKLSQTCAEDINAIKKINRTWAQHSSIAYTFCRFFLNKSEKTMQSEYYALEIPQKGRPFTKIIGLFSTSKGNSGELKLDYIVTEPDFQYKNFKRNIKGVGEVMLGEVFNIAKEKHANLLNIFSTKVNFFDTTFKNASIQRFDDMDTSSFNITSRFYHLKSKSFDKYIKYIEQKYNFKFPSTEKFNPQ